MSFSSLRFRTFCHATEDEQKVRQALEFVTGGAPTSIQVTKGHHGNRIAVLEARLERKSDVEAFWARAAGAGLLAEMLADLDGCLSDDLCLCARLDKQEAYAGRLARDRGGDVVHLRAKVVVHPATREGALAAVKHYFGKHFPSLPPSVGN
jgi:RNA binding exosome subunit